MARSFSQFIGRGIRASGRSITGSTPQPAASPAPTQALDAHGQVIAQPSTVEPQVEHERMAPAVDTGRPVLSNLDDTQIEEPQTELELDDPGGFSLR
jgi:hypothetical protein